MKTTNTKLKKLITLVSAILVVFALIFTFASCGDDKTDTPTTTTPSTTEEVVTTEKEVVEPITDDETTSETETTTEEVTEAETTTKPAPETTKKQEYVPVETTKKVTTTKAPETTKKQESKPVKDEVNDFDTGELPTYADGSINFGAIDNDKIEEENGGIVYF